MNKIKLYKAGKQGINMRKEQPSWRKYVEKLAGYAITEMENSDSPATILISGSSSEEECYASIGDQKIPCGVKTENKIFYEAKDDDGIFYANSEEFEGECDLQKEVKTRGNALKKILEAYSSQSENIQYGLKLTGKVEGNTYKIKIPKLKRRTPEEVGLGFLRE